MPNERKTVFEALVEKWAPRLKGAHFVNIRVRINGDWKEYEGDDIAVFIREAAKNAR